MVEANPTHGLVARFLEQHGYTETLQTFRREAREYLEESITPSANTAEVDLIPVLSNLDLNATQSSSSDMDYYTTLVRSIDHLHAANILAVAVAPESRVVATSSTDKSVKLCYDFGDHPDLPQRIYRHHQGPVLSIEFHPRNPHLMLTTSMDGSSVLVDTHATLDDETPETSGVVQRFHDHQKYVVRGAFSPSGATIATASYDHTVCIYQENREGNDGVRYALTQTLQWEKVVNTLCFLNDVTFVVGLQGDNYLYYVTRSGESWTKIAFNLNENGDDHVSFSPVWLSFSRDGRKLLCTTDSASGLVLLLETHSAKQLKRYHIKPSDDTYTTRRHCWHPNGQYFYVCGGNDMDIHVICAETGNTAATLSGHKNTIRAMTLDADIGLISVGYDRQLKVWDRAEQMPVNR